MKVNEKSTVKIGRKEIKTKLANLTDAEKIEIINNTEAVRKLTADDVDENGKIVKKENK